jgi:hypothetical protein
LGWFIEEVLRAFFEWLWTKRWGKPFVVLFLAAMAGLAIYAFVFLSGPSRPN